MSNSSLLQLHFKCSTEKKLHHKQVSLPVVLMQRGNSGVVYICYTVCPLPAYLAVNNGISVRCVYTPTTVKIGVIDCCHLLLFMSSFYLLLAIMPSAVKAVHFVCIFFITKLKAPYLDVSRFLSCT